MEESWVRRPFSKEYGIGFWREGNVAVVEGSSVGVLAIVMTVFIVWSSRRKSYVVCHFSTDLSGVALETFASALVKIG